MTRTETRPDAQTPNSSTVDANATDGPPTSPRVLDIAFQQGAIDLDAVDAVKRLQREGFTTYLVGGGVRDLLLGREPKDFDISTAAEPRVVRRYFRNARLIGRRFQIVHLRYGNRVFEVSCFRKREEPEDGGMREPLASENNYGSPREDAFARDFTVNALFYDPVQHLVIDHVGGLGDLEAGVLRSVGDPRVWYYEDPVRILRAAKFAGRLGFALPEEERAAMRERAELLHICPPSRVTEELFRILESGASSDSYRTLWETGVLEALIPELVEGLDPAAGADQDLFRMLRALDYLVVAHGGLPRAFLHAVLFYPTLRARLLDDDAGAGEENGPSWGAAVEDWLQERCLTLHIPRAYRARQRVLMSMIGHVLSQEGARRRIGRLVRQSTFPELMTLLRLHHRVFDDVSDVYNVLRRRAEEHSLDLVPSAHARPLRPERGGTDGGDHGRDHGGDPSGDRGAGRRGRRRSSRRGRRGQE